VGRTRSEKSPLFRGCIFANVTVFRLFALHFGLNRFHWMNGIPMNEVPSVSNIDRTTGCKVPANLLRTIFKSMRHFP
jgi:hypothetical protein